MDGLGSRDSLGQGNSTSRRETGFPPTVVLMVVGIYWINLGREAFGAVLDGRLVAALYWAPSDVGELDGPGGEPVVFDAGFCVVAVERPVDHWHVMDGDDYARPRALAEAEAWVMSELLGDGDPAGRRPDTPRSARSTSDE